MLTLRVLLVAFMLFNINRTKNCSTVTDMNFKIKNFALSISLFEEMVASPWNVSLPLCAINRSQNPFTDVHSQLKG